MNLPKYFHQNTEKSLENLIKRHPTPFLALDLSVIESRYRELSEGFPYADIFYAVKANPADKIIELLAALGANFDLASDQELDKVLRHQVSPERIAFGNTIKKRAAIEYFYAKGVRLFATDSYADLSNLAQYAPGSKVYIRLSFDGSKSADWPLSNKFGCEAETAVNLAVQARQLGLKPYGLSFHVGSQQRDVETWKQAIIESKAVFDRLEQEHQIKLQMLNIGGGLPARYTQKTDDFQTYADKINGYLQQSFDRPLPQIIIEPGRSLVGDAGILVSEVVLISEKLKSEPKRWVYTDVGTFNGLIETLGESIKYPIVTKQSGPKCEVVIAGPTCDSLDVMYEKHKYELPHSLEIGTHLFWLSTGAYTTSYSSIEFNGFPPLAYYYLDS